MSHQVTVQFLVECKWACAVWTDQRCWFSPRAPCARTGWWCTAVGHFPSVRWPGSSRWGPPISMKSAQFLWLRTLWFDSKITPPPYTPIPSSQIPLEERVFFSINAHCSSQKINGPSLWPLLLFFISPLIRMKEDFSVCLNLLFQSSYKKHTLEVSTVHLTLSPQSLGRLHFFPAFYCHPPMKDVWEVGKTVLWLSITKLFSLKSLCQ